jgi:serine/threonine-protein kinase
MPDIPARQRGNLPAAPRTVSVQPGSPAGDPPPPIPGYRELVQIGEGGMGVVYKAVSEDDGATVAIKAIRPALAPNQKTIGRFLREARVMQNLVHPHIVRFRQMGDLPGMLYFVMEFVPGTDAAKLMKERGSFTVPQVVGLAVQMMDALGYAHGKGFVHRDIKPANLLLKPADASEAARAPGGYVVKVADFGLARTYEASAMSGLTVSGAAGGTPHFMPPEQVTDFKSVKPPADQYAAAVTVYYLLSGKYPYDATGTAELLKKILTGKPTPLAQHRPDVPRGVADAVQKAMMTNPADRHADMVQFAAALRRGAGL